MSPILLFDCLMNRINQEKIHLDDYECSLKKELSLLLNTRLISQDDRDKKIPVFGLEEFPWTTTQSPLSQKKITRRIKEVVEYFEPRLKNVSVEWVSPSQKNFSGHVIIQGRYIFDHKPYGFYSDILLENLFFQKQMDEFT
jgi:type VI secretion system lysozyme-like protein